MGRKGEGGEWEGKGSILTLFHNLTTVHNNYENHIKFNYSLSCI